MHIAVSLLEMCLQKIRSVIVYDGKKPQPISPWGGHIGDFHSSIIRNHFLCPLCIKNNRHMYTWLCHFEGLANSSSVRLYNQSINQSCEWTCRGEGSIAIFVTHKQLTLLVFIMCAHEDDAITLEVVYCRAEGVYYTTESVIAASGVHHKARKAS